MVSNWKEIGKCILEGSKFNWKRFSCVLRNHRSQKKLHRGQNLECQLANEDDLQSSRKEKKILFH